MWCDAFERGCPMLRRADPESRRFEFVAPYLQQCFVLCDQPIGLRITREFEKFLIVWVAASGKGGGTSRSLIVLPDGAAIDFREVVIFLRVIQSEPRIAQHFVQFLESALVDNDVYAPVPVCGFQRHDRGILKNQPVDPYVGVEHQSLRRVQNFS